MTTYAQLVDRLAEQAGLSQQAAGWVALAVGLLNETEVPEAERERACKVVAVAGYVLAHPRSGRARRVMRVHVYEEEEINGQPASHR